LESGGLLLLLRRELYHISDMIDPAFAYRPELGETGGSPACENLIRDRYYALWSLFIEARLLRAGRATAATFGQRQALLRKAFSAFGDQQTETLVRTVSNATSLTHADLLALAR
jgi:hypothetical protein